MPVRIKTGEGDLDGGREIDIVELTHKQWPSGIQTEPSGGERVSVEGGGKVLRVCDLEAGCQGIDLRHTQGHVDKADGIEHLDGDSFCLRGVLDQRNRPLTEPGMTGNRENYGTAPPGHVQHTVGDRQVEIFEPSFALVEIVTVGHPWVGLQIGKTRVNPSSQEDPIGPI
jgi:hypothetical protein